MLDKRIERIAQAEKFRQHNQINLIASENFASKEVMALSGSWFTNKYAEGYPGKRYYNGCEYHDEIENLAIDYACELFKCEFANVQPHSGTNANLAIFNAFLEHGDRILSMSLDAGGHLSHGAPVSMVGKEYEIYHYGVDENGFLDYEEIERIAKEVKPKLIIAGASAYPSVIDWHVFRHIADEVGAYYLADMAHYSGLIAADVYPSPVPYADFVTSTTHKTLRGPRGGIILWNNPDYTSKINRSVFPGTQGGPMMNQIAAKAQCFYEAMDPSFEQYAWTVRMGARAMADTFDRNGFRLLTAGDQIGGTHSHMMIMDLSKEPYSGREASERLEENGIIVNCNMIPNDPRNARETSGIRLGTAAETTRQLVYRNQEECIEWFVELAEKITDILETLKNDKVNNL